MPITVNTNIPAESFPRIIALMIDFVIIYIYLFVLFYISVLINRAWPFHHLMEGSYLLRHLISFLSVTFPVVLYFVLMERSKLKATVGKAVMKLKVVHVEGGAAPLRCLITRNSIKFLPWEIAHTLVHLNFAAFISGEEPGTGVIMGLLMPQLIVLGYIIMILLRKDNRSLYEILSGTCVVTTQRL